MEGLLRYIGDSRFCFRVDRLVHPDYKTVRVEQGAEESARGSLKETILYILKTPTMIYLYLASAAVVMVTLHSAHGDNLFRADIQS